MNPLRNESARRRTWRASLDVVAALAMIVASGFLIKASLDAPGPSRRAAPRPVPSRPVSLEGASILGSTGAPAVLIVYSDFECPYCGRFARETLPLLQERYVKQGWLLIAFRHLPLERIHPFALTASTAAFCAGHAGLFWEMHDLLFENQGTLDDRTIREKAMALRLDLETFDRCVNGAEAVEEVRRDAEEARGLGIASTPTMLVGSVPGNHGNNGRVKVIGRFDGHQAFEQLSVVIDRILAETPPVPSGF